jgi:hypothetical protein
VSYDALRHGIVTRDARADGDGFQDLAQGFSVVTVDADDQGAVSFRGYETGDFEGKKVFLFDGAVHSGSKIQSCTRKLLSLGATGICTYSLVLMACPRFLIHSL